MQQVGGKATPRPFGSPDVAASLFSLISPSLDMQANQTFQYQQLLLTLSSVF